MGSFLLLSFFCSIVFLLCLSFSFLYYPFFLFFHQTHSYYRSVGNQISLSLFLFRVSCLVSICVCVSRVYLCLPVSICVYLCLCLPVSVSILCLCSSLLFLIILLCCVTKCLSVRPSVLSRVLEPNQTCCTCMHACVPPHFRVAFFPLSVPCFEFHFPPRIIFLSCRIQSFLFLFPSLPLVSLLDDDDDDDDCDSQRTLVDSR